MMTRAFMLVTTVLLTAGTGVLAQQPAPPQGSGRQGGVPQAPAMRLMSPAFADSTTVPATPELPDGSRQIMSMGRGGAMTAGFRNLCTPPNDPPHHFIFELFALDYKPDLDPMAARADVERAIDGHIIGHAVLVGLFGR